MAMEAALRCAESGISSNKCNSGWTVQFALPDKLKLAQ